MKNSTHCGIDFGTGNSAMASASKESVQLAKLEDDSYLLPSTLFFSDETGQTHFGRDATQLYMDEEEGRYMVSPKSALGTTLIREKTVVHNKPTPFRDVIKVLLQQIKTQGEKELGKKTQVVIGRPVRFSDRDDNLDAEGQKVLHEVAQETGFKDVEFLFEPIAAALDYERSITREEIALVVDLGAGTSDFSVLRLSPDRHDTYDRQPDILSNSGVHIGGNDFDKSFSLHSLMPHFGMNSHMKTVGGI